MEQNCVEAAYEEPLVLDAGDVVEVTLGTKKFDSADDTEYKVD